MNIPFAIQTAGDWTSKGTHLLRDLLTKLFTSLSIDGSLWIPFIFALVALIFAYKIVKNFVTTPFSSRYILWYLIIAALIFWILNYL